MWIIGLTGAVGAGKSSAAEAFRQIGIPVHCSDAYIHFLFEHDPEVQQQVKHLWPEVFVKGKIDRLLLGNRVFFSIDDLSRLEDILYPKLLENQRKFLMKNQYLDHQIVVLDIPLLFEVGLDLYCDYVILVSASSSLREQRVMKREGMTVKKLHSVEDLQLKESERRKRADFIIYTGLDKGNALKNIKRIVCALSQKPSQKWQGKWPKILKRRPHESGNRLRYRNNRI